MAHHCPETLIGQSDGQWYFDGEYYPGTRPGCHPSYASDFRDHILGGECSSNEDECTDPIKLTLGTKYRVTREYTEFDLGNHARPAKIVRFVKKSNSHYPGNRKQSKYFKPRPPSAAAGDGDPADCLWGCFELLNSSFDFVDADGGKALCDCWIQVTVPLDPLGNQTATKYFRVFRLIGSDVNRPLLVGFELEQAGDAAHQTASQDFAAGPDTGSLGTGKRQPGEGYYEHSVQVRVGGSDQSPIFEKCMLVSCGLYYFPR